MSQLVTLDFEPDPPLKPQRPPCVYFPDAKGYVVRLGVTPGAVIKHRFQTRWAGQGGLCRERESMCCHEEGYVHICVKSGVWPSLAKTKFTAEFSYVELDVKQSQMCQVKYLQNPKKEWKQVK